MATAAARRKYNTPGVVNGSLAYDFKTLERQLENTGYMEPDGLTRPGRCHCPRARECKGQGAHRPALLSGDGAGIHCRGGDAGDADNELCGADYNLQQCGGDAVPAGDIADSAGGPHHQA